MSDPATRLRWTLADAAGDQTALFAEAGERVRHPEFRGMEFLHVRAKRIINEVPAAARVPFRYTINAYRGCSHACTYCFARPSHAYLNLDTDRDFERVVVVKVNAVEALRAELQPRRWAGEHIAMGTNTDPYQRCEGRYRLTRGIVEVLAEHANPFSLLTKSALVLRDLDVLTEAAGRTVVTVSLSIGTLAEGVWRASEPGTPHPRRRVEAVAALTEAGIRSGVLVAPIIPGMSDDPAQLEAVVRACVEAGAVSVTPIVLHLRPGVRELFMPWLEGLRPDLLPRYAELYRGSYAPRSYQRGIQRLVADLVRSAGGTRPHASRSHRTSRSRQGPREPADPRRPRPAEQLPLDPTL